MGTVAKVIGGVALVAVVWVVTVGSDDEGPSGGGESTAEKSGAQEPAKVAAATIDKSDAMQAKRRELLEKLIAQGVFQKIEVPGNLPRVWVRPAFYQLDFDTKQSFASVVYAYHFDGSNPTDSVRLFDSMSGKEVGSFAPPGGLTMF